MQSLRPDEYDRLRRLAEVWWQQQSRDLKASPRYNPRLTVDALCFQRLASSPSDDDAATSAAGTPDVDYLVGALVSPVSLSLVLVPASAEAAAPQQGEQQRFVLPSGRYPFTAERLESSLWLWRCELLDDLSDVGSRQEASRLAQQLMDRVTTPEE